MISLTQKSQPSRLGRVSRQACLAGFVALALSHAALAADGVYKVELLTGQTVFTDITPVPGSVKSFEKVGNAAPSAELTGAVGRAASKYPVTLFTAGNCGQCDSARAYLKQRGVPFSEKIISTDADVQLYKPMIGGELGVPLMKIGNDKIGPGYNQGTWQTILDAAGYPAKNELPPNYDYGIPKPLAEIRAQAPAPAAATGQSQPAKTASVPGPIQFAPVPPPPTVRF